VRKATLLVIVATIAATPLAASWWPYWEPTFVALNVGERATIHLQAKWSGLVDYGNGIHFSFRTENVAVAVAAVSVNDESLHAVEIVAVGPGNTSISEALPNDKFGWQYVKIRVLCTEEPAVRAATPVVLTRLGEAVTLKAVSDIAERTRFTWYLGHVGDTSHPLAATGPEVALVPRAGVQYVWVAAVTTCSASSAEFRIETLARVRAAGR